LEKLSIKKCPTCGSNKIEKVCKDWESTAPVKKYKVPSLEYYECSVCGEELYDAAAMRKIESYSLKILNRSSKERISKRNRSSKKHIKPTA
jgi:YgiT-type zinc finger domain-containing protein